MTARLLSGERSQDAGDDVRAESGSRSATQSGITSARVCFRNGLDSVVTLLWWEEEAQIIDLEEEEERNAARRTASIGGLLTKPVSCPIWTFRNICFWEYLLVGLLRFSQLQNRLHHRGQ